MADKVYADARVYTDIQGLKQLKYDYKNNQASVKKEVSQQFESILMQMVMQSMRDANKAFASSDDGASSDQMAMYQDMFDKQLSLMISNSGLGLAKIIENNIDQQMKTVNTRPLESPQLPKQPMSLASPSSVESIQAPSAPTSATESVAAAQFKTPEDFVKKLWTASKQAADMIGLSPELLLAQAALETNWGKSVIAHNQGSSTHNLFNIKADPSWTNKTVTMDTLEQSQGMLVKERSAFRSYDSFQDSFQDYVKFLQSNDRYSEALSNTASPDQFMGSLQKAGYATDQQYADKVMKIFKSSSFQQAVMKIKSNDLSF